MPIGTVVCEGQYCSRLEQNPHWYRHDFRAPTKLFRLQYFLCGGIQVRKFVRGEANGPRFEKTTMEDWQKKTAHLTVFKVPKEAVLAMDKERTARESFDYTEIEYEGSDEEGDEIDQADEESDDAMEVEEELEED